MSVDIPALFKKIDINKIKHPITLIDLATFLLFIFIIKIPAQTFQDERYRLIFIIISILCFSAIIIRCIKMTENLSNYGREKIARPIKKVEDNTLKIEQQIDIT